MNSEQCSAADQSNKFLGLWAATADLAFGLPDSPSLGGGDGSKAPPKFGLSFQLNSFSGWKTPLWSKVDVAMNHTEGDATCERDCATVRKEKGRKARDETAS